MALSEQVTLNIQQAQRQIDDLERQLDQLSQPVPINVDVDGGNELAQMRRDLGLADSSVEGLNRELGQTDDALRRVGREADQVGDEFDTVGRKGNTAFSGLGRSILGFTAALGAFQGARAFVDFAGDAIDAASDLEESTSKAQVVFGEFFSDIEDFSATAPQALGLANAQALEFAGTFGNLFVALGLSQQAAADLSPDIVQLGADLASFNNIDVTEALDKLRAGLVGEAEPLRVLGVNLTAASTAAKAVELGLAASTSEVSEAAKVQARYALILEQTNTAQGDFARTADGIANTQRTLSGEVENLRAVFGQALLPALSSILEVAPAAIEAIERGLVPAFVSLGDSIANADTSGLIAFLSGLPTGIETVFTGAAAGAEAFGNALQIITLNGGNIGGIGEQFAQLGEDLQRLREAPIANEALQNLFTTLAGGAEPIDAIESALVALGENVSGLTLDTFEDLVDQMVLIASTSGASGPELAALASVVEEIGEAAGFSAPGVELLAEALRGPLSQAQAEASVGDIIAANLASVGEAAEEATPLVSGFGSALSTSLSGDVGDVLAGVREEYEKLPGVLEAARAALETEGEETVETTGGFITDLETELGRIEDFTADINLAKALGLDDTAALAQELGLDFAPILADAVDNPETAAQLEGLLEDFAEAEAAFFRSATQTALLEEFDDPFDIPIDIQFELGNISLPGIGNLLDNVVVGAPSAPGGNGSTGGNNVTQNFFTEPAPSPATARAGQQISAIVAN